MPTRDVGIHLPEGKYWLRVAAIWEDSKTARIQYQISIDLGCDVHNG